MLYNNYNLFIYKVDFWSYLFDDHEKLGDRRLFGETHYS